MNVQIVWEDGIPDIYAAMSGDREAFIRVARLVWGDAFVDGIIAESNRKVQRVEDILDDKDPLERIEKLLEATLSRPSRSSPMAVEPDEMSTREAWIRLGVSAKTLRKLVRAGLLARRNSSPPGSGKARFRYRIVDIDRLKSQGYHKVAQPQESNSSKPKARRRKPEPQTYEHLDL